MIADRSLSSAGGPGGSGPSLGGVGGSEAAVPVVVPVVEAVTAEAVTPGTGVESPRVEVVLRDYRIVFEGENVTVSGPDGQAIDRIWLRARKLLASEGGRKFLRWYHGTRDERRLEEAEDKLIEALAVPPRIVEQQSTANEAQKTYARHLGLEVPENISARYLAQRVAEFERVRFYVQMVWVNLTGKRSDESGVPAADLHRVVLRLLNRNPEMLRRIQSARVTLDTEAAEKSEGTHAAFGSGKGGDYTSARFLKLDPRDPVFKEVALLLQHDWKTYLPRKSVFGGWFGK